MQLRLIPFLRVLAPAVLAASLLCLPRGWAQEVPAIGPLLSAPEKQPDAAPATTEPAAAPAKDQDDAATKTPAEAPQPVDAQLVDEREKVAEKLRVAQRQLEEAKAAGEENSAPTRPLARKPELLKKRDTLLAQRQAASARHGDLLASLSRARKRAENVDEALPDDGPPYSFLLLEKLRDSVDTETARSETNEAAVASAQEALKQARAELEEKQNNRVLAKEALRKHKGPEPSEELRTALELAELEVEVAGEEVKLREAELVNEKLTVEANETRLRTAKARLAKVQKAVAFTRDDLQEYLVQLDAAERELNALVESLGAGSVAARLVEEQWMDARGRLEGAPQRSPALTEEVAAWRRARQTQQQKLALASQQLRRLTDMRTAWNRRFAVLNGPPPREELDKWTEETEQALEQLGRETRLATIRVDQLRKELAALEERAKQADRQVPETARWIERQRHEIQQQLTAYDADRAQIDASRRLHGATRNEIQELTNSGAVRDWLAGAGRSIKKTWNFVLTTSGPNESPITIGKIVSGLLLVVLGYVLAKWLSTLLAGRLPRRFGMTQNAAAALETLSFYLLLAMFTITALYYVDVPLTAFTIAGGAVALGVGFGSQNIMNNFISGLIILAEQPIRVGDQIQIEGMSARVEHIGARSTRVRTASNQEIIVPNSTFLQNNVVNWTLSDNNVRGEVKVGVAYGTNLEEARSALLAAASQHELVMVQPAPFVWFVEFGDNALQFELHFWVQMASSSQRRQIESDIRFAIDRLFRERNLTIAYPQRDVHLDVSRPLAIRLVDPQEHAGAVSDYDHHAA